MAGFDLVGQEDITRPIVEMIEPLLTLPELIHRFFHAGETNWYGTTSDENLVCYYKLKFLRLFIFHIKQPN